MLFDLRVHQALCAGFLSGILWEVEQLVNGSGPADTFNKAAAPLASAGFLKARGYLCLEVQANPDEQKTKGMT